MGIVPHEEVGRAPRSGIVRFLSFLFDGYPSDAGLTCEIRCLKPCAGEEDPERVERRWFGLETEYLTKAAAYARSMAATHDVFVGVLPRRGKGGFARDVTHARMLFCDVDAGNDRAGVFALMSESGLLEHVSALVETPSGGGHVYWRLAGTVELIGEKRDQYRRMLKRIVRAIGGEKPGPHADGNAAEEARVLRVPGTLYHKTDPPARIPRWFSARTAQHRASWWQRALPVLPAAPEPRASAPIPAPALRGYRDDEELLAAAMRKPEFAALWLGDTTSYGMDDSRADMALMVRLAWWTDRDPARMERLFGRSVLGRRDKWRRADYRQRTVEHALVGAR